MDNSASIYNTNDRKRPTAEPHKSWNSDGSSTQVLNKRTHVSARDISKTYADLLFLKEIYSLRPNNAHINLLPVFNSDYIKDISVSDLHPDYKPHTALSDIGFSFRTKNVLKTMGLKTVGELMCTPKNQFMMQNNFNLKCFNEIYQIIKKLVFENLADSLPLKDTFSQPPNNATIDLLPVFNPQSIENISTSDLHPDFKPYTKLSDIVFSVRTKNVLNRTGLKTVGELMCTPKNQFMEQKNFGRKSFNEIYQIIKQLVFENLLGDSLANNLSKDTVPTTCLLVDSISNPKNDGTRGEYFIDYSSYETMVYNFVKGIINKGRSQKIIFDRLCFQNSKIPTLEELGLKHQVTRERARQIIFKSANILRIKSNFNKLAYFWNTVEKIIRNGGGVIHLDALAAALKDEFNWLQMPNPLALGQLLSLWLPNRKLKEPSAVIEIDCECLSCDRPLRTIQSFDFELSESYHLKVVERKLLDDCQKKCAHTPGPVLTFHDAFIEKVVSSSGGVFIIKGELLYPYNKWAVKFGKNLEDAITVVLKKQGRPMHYSEIALELRKESSIFEEMSDHIIHASLSRYQSVELVERGTFALKEWALERYQSVSDAIEELLRASYYPMQRQDIIAQLKEEFSEGNISASLSERTTRFIAIGDGFYDSLDRWQKRTYRDFMKELPDELHEFMTYLVTNNNCSYKLVLALVFIRGMNNDGTMLIRILKERFYNFFAARHAKGLVVEKDEVLASKLKHLDPTEFKTLTLKNPIISFLNSGFFIKIGSVIKLQSSTFQFLNMGQFKDIVTVILLKSINEYFSAIESPLETEHGISVDGAKISNATNDVSASSSDFSQEHISQSTADIAIKKIKRAKIQL